MLRNAGGDSFNHAKALKLKPDTTILKDRIGAGLGDFYRFTIKGHSSFNLNLKSVSGKAYLTLLQDENGNRRGDRNETITRLSAQHNAQVNAYTELAPGTYFIRVVPKQKQTTSYSLSLSASRMAGNSTLGASNSGSLFTSELPVSLSESSFVTEVLQLTNAFRQQNGLKPLSYSDRLATAAQTHSQNMAIQDFFSHTGLDGSTSQNRSTAAGYLGSVGENIAAGYATPQAVMQGWINSPGHRANLLNPSYREIGIGFYDLPNDTGNVNYNCYWAQDFGVPG